MERWVDDDRHTIRQGMDCIPHGLFRLAREAGRTLAAEDGPAFWAQTANLRKHSSPVVQHLLIEIYANLGVGCADAALRWLLDAPTRLEIGTGVREPEWMPAARLIEELSPHCSEMTFSDLEKAITHYHTPHERRDAKYWLSTWKNGYFGDYWGRAQRFLLPALCHKRRSIATEGLIGVLERKFCTYPEERFYREAGSRFGFVGSTLPGESLECVSDKAWLKIVTNKHILEDGTRRGRWVGNHWKESSVFQFSSNLRSIASRFPERFAQLALRFPDDVHPYYNEPSRYAINEICVRNNIPFVVGRVFTRGIGGEVFAYRPSGGGCLACLEALLQRTRFREGITRAKFRNAYGPLMPGAKKVGGGVVKALLKRR